MACHNDGNDATRRSANADGGGYDDVPEGGHPHDNCSDVLRDVWLFLDDELDPDRRAAVQRHLDDCSPCLEEAGIDTKLKALLARKCGGEHAPEPLRERIISRLVTVRRSSGGASSSITTTSVTVERHER